MMKWQDAILNSNGQPVSGAAVLVTPSGTNTATSAIFNEAAGTSSRANPLTSDSYGRFWFYGNNGRYDLVISGAGINPTTMSDVMLEDVPLSNLAELSTASNARSNLGLGSAAVVSTGTFLQTANNLSELSTGTLAAAARANLAAATTTGSQSFVGGQRNTPVALASTGQITPNFAAGNNFTLSMTVNTTLAAGTGGLPGQEGRIVITQNSTAKTLAYDSSFYRFAAAATATLSTATVAGTRDVLRYYIMDSTSCQCEIRNLVS